MSKDSSKILVTPLNTYDFFEYLVEGIAVDDTWEIDLIQLMRHPNVTFRVSESCAGSMCCGASMDCQARHEIFCWGGSPGSFDALDFGSIEEPELNGKCILDYISVIELDS